MHINTIERSIKKMIDEWWLNHILTLAVLFISHFSSLFWKPYLVYTNERAQKSSKLKVFFIVEERKQPGWLCEQMPKCRGNSEAALDQVSHAEHSDETLGKLEDILSYNQILKFDSWILLSQNQNRVHKINISTVSKLNLKTSILK